MKSVSISVIFKALAQTLMERSSKGDVAIVVRDSNTNFTKTYKDVADLLADKSKMTIANYNAVLRTFLGKPQSVTVVKLGTAATVADMITILAKYSFNYLTLISDSTTDHNELVAWVKSINTKRFRAVKYVAYNATAPDDMHVINFKPQSVKFVDDSSELDGYHLLGRIAGVLAGLPYSKSVTYFELNDVEIVTELADLDAEIEAGFFCLTNMEGKVFVARGNNSLKTTEREDLKSIAIVEGMDLMVEDIKTTWRDKFVGEYKNSGGWRNIFISVINDYLRTLTDLEVLDSAYKNAATINATAVRAYESARGNDTSALTDDQAKEISTGTKVFAKANVKFLDAMEDLDFEIHM